MRSKHSQQDHHHNSDQASRRPHMMCTIRDRRSATPRFAVVRGGRGRAQSVVRPWVPISSQLTHMVYLFTFFSCLGGSKAFPPIRPSARLTRIRWQIPLYKLSPRRTAKPVMFSSCLNFSCCLRLQLHLVPGHFKLFLATCKLPSDHQRHIHLLRNLLKFILFLAKLCWILVNGTVEFETV